VEPDVIICDEAVSSLDLSVQAQVVNLLAGLSARRGMANLFISHDLSVVRHISDQIVVLFAGQVVESGPAAQVAEHPVHPYTEALVLAAPVPDLAAQARRRAERLRLAASPGRPADQPSKGCPYAPRCPFGIGRCATDRPSLVDLPTGSKAACHVKAPDQTNQGGRT
jgi:peptide/nickel transport system ATP-binding protein